jgi:hypothetical protein
MACPCLNLRYEPVGAVGAGRQGGGSGAWHHAPHALQPSHRHPRRWRTGIIRPRRGIGGLRCCTALGGDGSTSVSCQGPVINLRDYAWLETFVAAHTAAQAQQIKEGIQRCARGSRSPRVVFCIRLFSLCCDPTGLRTWSATSVTTLTACCTRRGCRSRWTNWWRHRPPSPRWVSQAFVSTHEPHNTSASRPSGPCVRKGVVRFLCPRHTRRGTRTRRCAT